MKNKIGAAYGKDFALGIIILIIFLIFLFGGGFGTLLKLTTALKSIPTFVWIIFGGIILLKLIGGRK